MKIYRIHWLKKVPALEVPGTGIKTEMYTDFAHMKYAIIVQQIIEYDWGVVSWIEVLGI